MSPHHIFPDHLGTSAAPLRSHCAAQRGLTLIELMISLLVGLLLVAAALQATAFHLKDNRHLQQEQRLVNDLRAAMDMITRDLRRAAHWQAAEAGVWTPAASAVPRNPHGVSFSATPYNHIDFSYSGDMSAADRVASNEQYGYRLRDGVLQVHVGAAGWQALTDPAALTVTALHIEPHAHTRALTALCAQPCAATQASAPTCPPQVHTIEVGVFLSAHAAQAPQLQSQLRSRVHLRNDRVTGECAP